MNILLISASASKDSGNYYLLKAIAKHFVKQHEVEVYQGLYDLALFSPMKLKQGVPENIQVVKNKISAADLIFLSTPEYTHNIPAVLKSLIEWCTASGEFFQKRVVPITFTPHKPRGKYAMESLISSLHALEAKVVTQLSLYKTEVEIKQEEILLNPEHKELLMAILEL